MKCDRCEHNGMRDIWVKQVLCQHPQGAMGELCLGHIFEKKDFTKCPFLDMDIEFIKEGEMDI